VAEAIHCPSCSTRYRLSPERVKPVIRRAKCFSCGSAFSIGDIVQRLLALPPHNATAGFTFDAVAAAQKHEPEATHEHAPEPAIEAPESPSLTLGDLDVADSEILEQTLVTVPEPLPEAKPEAAPSYPPEITETTLSGYTSARDAIEKLFGSSNAPAAGLKISPDSNPMDMEATLSALESTLGAPQPTPASVGTITHGDSPTASGLTEEDLSGPSTSTMRLTQEDLQAILASAPPAAPAAEPTVALRASDFAGAEHQSRPSTYATAPTFASLPDSPESGSELLRLKIGEDIYSGLTMPQLIAWVEEGRILENHLVARQHSENWLEAHKVPGLRPVFERLRRERSGGAINLSALADSGPKKSLFGGLFGKN